MKHISCCHQIIHTLMIVVTVVGLLAWAPRCLGANLQDIIEGIEKRDSGQEAGYDQGVSGVITGNDAPLKPVRFMVTGTQLGETLPKAFVLLGHGTTARDFQAAGWGVLITNDGHFMTTAQTAEKLLAPQALHADLRIDSTELTAVFIEQGVAVLRIASSTPSVYVPCEYQAEDLQLKTLSALSWTYAPPPTPEADKSKAEVSKKDQAPALQLSAVEMPIPAPATGERAFESPMALSVDAAQPEKDAPVFSSDGRLVGVYFASGNKKDHPGMLMPLRALREKLPVPSDQGVSLLKYDISETELREAARGALVMVAHYCNYNGWQLGRFGTGCVVDEGGTVVTAYDVLSDQAWGWVFDVSDKPDSRPPTPRPTPVGETVAAIVPGAGGVVINNEFWTATPTPQAPGIEAQIPQQGWTRAQAQRFAGEIENLIDAPQAVQAKGQGSLQYVVRCGPFASQQDASEKMGLVTGRGYKVESNLMLAATTVTPGTLFVKTINGQLLRASSGQSREDPLALGLLSVRAGGTSLRYLPLVEGLMVKTGEPVGAVGIPRLPLDVRSRREQIPLEYLAGKQVEPTSSSGKVSHANLDLTQGAAGRTTCRGVQLDTLVDAGWRGGPMLNAHGEVIAIINTGKPDQSSQITGCAIDALLEQFSGLRK